MKTIIIVLSLASTFALVACDKPTVVNVPADTVVVPSQAGPAGATGETGATGDTGATGAPSGDTTIVIPPPVADMPPEIVPDPALTPESSGNAGSTESSGASGSSDSTVTPPAN